MRTADLDGTYRSKSDDELIILSQSDGLSAEAQLVLHNELRRRGIVIDADASDREEPEPTLVGKLSQPAVAATYAASEFLAAVTRIYREHFVLFLKLTLPAVAIGYVAIILARQEGRELARELLRQGSVSRNLIFLKVALINNAGQFIGGLASCLSFATICAAIGRISSGRVAHVSGCVREVREHIRPVLRLSLLLIALVWLVIIVSGLVGAGFFFFVVTRERANVVELQAIILTLMCCGFLLVSRFGLAMPAVVLGNCKVRSAMFRSNELTERRWLTLAVLLLKSVLGGYVSAMLPFWVAIWLWRYVQLPSWFLTLSSYLGVTLVEPFMFIGFALLYVRMSSPEATFSGVQV